LMFKNSRKEKTIETCNDFQNNKSMYTHLWEFTN
jgi:hypothetical protein